VRKVSIVLAILIVIAGLAYVVRARGMNDRAEADAEPLFVPTLVTPSIQIANGQVLLYKATNLAESTPRNIRLMLFNEQDSVPTVYKDFSRIGAGQTVSYVYEPPMAQLALGDVTVDAPKAVRAVFGPQPAGDPGAMRSIVATVQIMRVEPAGKNGTALLEAPIIVPVEHCNFEPRGFVPYTGGRWYWNCAPQMYPIDERWRQAGQGNAGSGEGGGRGGTQGGRGGRSGAQGGRGIDF